ncbi:MAG: hypothetical protein WAM73_19565, partial [Desulfobacterales bacterium]
ALCFKIKLLSAGVGRWRITLQPPLSGLAKIFILKPMVKKNKKTAGGKRCTAGRFFSAPSNREQHRFIAASAARMVAGDCLLWPTIIRSPK